MRSSLTGHLQPTTDNGQRTVLGIESTCDETAAAIVVDGRTVLSNIIATQFELHARYRGVVPEIASRAHIEKILPVIREACATAGVKLQDIDAIAVAQRPGLIGSLLIGVTAAKTLAWALGKPLIAVDHVHAHLYSVMLDPPNESNIEHRTSNIEHRAPNENPSAPHSRFDVQCSMFDVRLPPSFPAIGLVCSGGHTAIYYLKDWNTVQRVGSTIDDAVGEAYDKVAAILNLGYPGGPILDRLAASGNPEAVKLPRTLLGRESLDFSFSGLKTAVLYHVRGVPRKGQSPRATTPPLDERTTADIAASFQAACIDVITTKLRRAIEQYDAASVIVGGGVSANRGLRDALATLPAQVWFPNKAYCTDNAAMIAGLGSEHFEHKRFTDLNIDAITYSQFTPHTGVAGFAATGGG